MAQLWWHPQDFSGSLSQTARGALQCLPAAPEHWAAGDTEAAREPHTEMVVGRDTLAPCKLLEEKVARRKVEWIVQSVWALPQSFPCPGRASDVFVSVKFKETDFVEIPSSQRQAALAHVTERFPVSFQLQANLHGHKQWLIVWAKGARL